jgi:hypothetical protein
MSSHKFFARPGWQGTRRDPFLFAAHLSECRKVALQHDFDLKVILGIRRQDQYLASRYATHGGLADNPGQLDFERQVLEILEPRYYLDGVWLDYAKLRDLVVGALGDQSRLIMLPLEQLNEDPQSYLGALSVFIGETLDYSGDRANVRRVAADRWKLLDNKAIKRLSAGGIAARARGAIRRRRPRHSEFFLPSELQAAVLDRFADSNRQLATDLGIDLNRYGYIR